MKTFDKSIGIFDIIILVVLILVFYFMTYVCESDITAHAEMLRKFVNNEATIPSNFLYYFTVYFFAFFTSSKTVLLLVSVYLLSIITFWKYYLIKNFFIQEIKNINYQKTIVISVVSFSFLFLFALPILLLFVDYVYLLSFAPTIWHNSTVIFVMPFALLLYWQTLKQLKEFSFNRLLILLFLILLNIAAKPSYIFVYAMAYPLILLKKYRFSKLFWLNLIPIFFALIFILMQYLVTYKSTIGEVKSFIKIDLFHLFTIWTQSKSVFYLLFLFIVSLISSFLFPIILLVKNKYLLKQENVQLAILGVIFGIIIGITFYESGPREFHGNLMWQTFIASFILFFICTLQLLKLVLNKKDGWKNHLLEITSFIIHFLSGLYYLSRIFFKLDYL